MASELTSYHGQIRIDQVDLKLNFIELCKLIYESVCILEPFYKNEVDLNQSFHRILDRLAISFHIFLTYNDDARFKEYIVAFKSKLCDKLMFILKQDLFHSNFGYEIKNDTFNTFGVGQNILDFLN